MYAKLSRAQILEERQEREGLEDVHNELRDKLAASTIELNQKDDELQIKDQEMEEFVAEHDRIIVAMEDEYGAELERAKRDVKELQDVSTLRFVHRIPEN